LKSWVFYDSIDTDSQARYYVFDIEKGQQLYVSAMTPDRGPFVPSIAVAADVFDENDTLPQYVEIPNGAGVIAAYGQKGDAEYEPFTPGAYYHTAEISLDVPESGTYYAVIFSQGTGPVALVIGRKEMFTPVEIAKVPFDTISIHLWEGQHPLRIALPFFLVAAATLIYAWKKKESSSDIFHIASLVAGSVFSGSAAYTLYHALRSASVSGINAMIPVTLIFVLIAAVLARSCLLWGMRGRTCSGMDRVRFAAIALLGVSSFSGFVIAPALCTLLALFMHKAS